MSIGEALPLPIFIEVSIVSADLDVSLSTRFQVLHSLTT